MDVLIKNCQYPDFLEGKMKKGNIALEEGKILWIKDSIHKEDEEEAENTIDGEGKVLSPGFIDIHMHEENFLIEGKEYIIANMMLEQGVTTCVGGQCGVLRQKVDDFRQIIEEMGGSPVNYITLTGYNTLRTVKGIGRHEQPTEEQLQELIEEVNLEIHKGSFGVSFGIEYDPGITLDEMLEVVWSIPDEEILVAAHFRQDGMGAIESIEEMIEIQNKIKQKFQISHLSSCSAMGQMKETLDRIEKGIEENPNLSFDMYPYNAFSTSMGSEVFSEGCFIHWEKDYEDILLTDEPYKNVRCTQEIFDECREHYPNMLAVAFVMNEEEIEMALAHKEGMIASDGIINNGNGHPRAAGTFPRVLGRYVREKGVLSMYDALRKMTYVPAERLKLSEKGRIEEGMDADLVLFDPETIIDCATYEDISLKPEGIEYVWIDGQFAIKDGKVVNNRLGNYLVSEKRYAHRETNQ
ncbi:amidohydrolase family protein [Peptoniphilus sp. KCTC 25270]|uniref:amidohydrolase family protein n=1 Tax=Peptoniphilus sp. KCTC 25270 TaxID=2897414 RepID=UPI001E29BE4E|nr:amidohydrolase family protein [Peptoniphilus sp. KCTC 25270]MCD1147811.1 amidohydrolase family protein [Peptoniphilus sp. KCTC 25270]